MLEAGVLVQLVARLPIGLQDLYVRQRNPSDESYVWSCGPYTQSPRAGSVRPAGICVTLSGQLGSFARNPRSQQFWGKSGGARVSCWVH